MSRMLDLGAVTVMVVGDDRKVKRTHALESYVNAVLWYMRENTEVTLEQAIVATHEGVMAEARKDPEAPTGVEEELAGFADEMHEIVQEARDIIALVDGRVQS